MSKLTPRNRRISIPKQIRDIHRCNMIILTEIVQSHLPIDGKVIASSSLRKRDLNWNENSAIILKHRCRCQKCGSTDRLQVHEKFILDFDNHVSLLDCIVLCESCHNLEHVASKLCSDSLPITDYERLHEEILSEIKMFPHLYFELYGGPAKSYDDFKLSWCKSSFGNRGYNLNGVNVGLTNYWFGITFRTIERVIPVIRKPDILDGIIAVYLNYFNSFKSAISPSDNIWINCAVFESIMAEKGIEVYPCETLYDLRTKIFSKSTDPILAEKEYLQEAFYNSSHISWRNNNLNYKLYAENNCSILYQHHFEELSKSEYFDEIFVLPIYDKELPFESRKLLR